MTGSASIIRGDALALPLADDSVDLIVTSPPYFALRAYATDGGREVGSASDWRAYLDGLVEATREMARVVKPTGSIFVDLGDKYASGGRTTYDRDGKNEGRGGSRPVDGFPEKSLMLLPERYRIRCVDDLGLICRSVIVWDKPNGLPESVTDRVKRSHEDWVHLTRRLRYFSAIDEIRQPHQIARYGRNREGAAFSDTRQADGGDGRRHLDGNPLGALPGSVWTIPTEPLKVPDYLRADDMEAGEGSPDHFAAFPTEWPRRLIEGFSPSGICTECGQGRRPVMGGSALDESRPQARRAMEIARQHDLSDDHLSALKSVGRGDVGYGIATQSGSGKNTAEVQRLADEARRVLGGYSREFMGHSSITGYACGCDEPTAPTRPAVVLDPFGGTGTTALAAKATGRHGITVDLSADYARLARWRTTDAHQIARVTGRHWTDRQGTLL